MALTNDQLLDRIEAIETRLNEIQVVLNNLVTAKQMKTLANLRQQEIINLQTDVATLQAQIAALQS